MSIHATSFRKSIRSLVPEIAFLKKNEYTIFLKFNKIDWTLTKYFNNLSLHSILFKDRIHTVKEVRQVLVQQKRHIDCLNSYRFFFQ